MSSPYAGMIPFHFGRANSGLRTACGLLLSVTYVDCGHIIRPAGNLDAVTCGRCQRTTAYRTARHLQAAGK